MTTNDNKKPRLSPFEGSFASLVTDDGREEKPELFSPLHDIVVVDVETTGLIPFQNQVIEIGAVFLDDREEFETRVRFDRERRWSEEAEAVHGYTRESCEDPTHPEIHEALELFLDWLEFHRGERRLVLAGMNPRFDLDMLRADARAVDRLSRRMNFRFSHRTLDMHSLCVRYAVRMGLSADAITRLHTDQIYDLLGMEPEPRPHRAITGARMEADALSLLLQFD